ncbi:MAG: recombinase family protein, partial [Chitinophagaceae bacterium]
TYPNSNNAIIFKEQNSAWKENVKRPEFEGVISMIKSRKLNSIYVWNLDRIYRNRKKLIEFLTLCRNYGTRVFSFNQQWLDSIQQMDAPFNEIIFDLMLQIIGWIAEDESTTKSKRVKMAVRVRNGHTVSYKGNKWGRKPFPRQTISRVMQYHSEGKSIRQIAKLVQVYDRCNNGRPISKSAVHKIITSISPQNERIIPVLNND